MNTVSEIMPAQAPAPTVHNRALASFTDQVLFDQLWRGAKAIAASQLIPKHFQNKPEDCFIGLHMAGRLGADPIMVLQNLYVVHGTPGWSAKFIIAQANTSKVFKGRIKFRYEGEELPDVTKSSLKVTAYATMDDGSDDVVEAVASMDMARAEGWTQNAKYKGMQRQMLSYRAATLLVRLYAPEVLMGVPVIDELEDIDAAANGPSVTQPAMRTYTPTELNSLLKAEQKNEPEPPPAPKPAAVAELELALCNFININLDLFRRDQCSFEMVAVNAADVLGFNVTASGVEDLVARNPALKWLKEPEPKPEPAANAATPVQHKYPDLLNMIDKAKDAEELDYIRSLSQHLDAPMRAKLAENARARLKIIMPDRVE